MIIWVASYPRSGNSLYREIIWQTCGLRTFSVYPNNTHVEETTGHVQINESDYEKLDRGQDLYFVKTHALQEDHSYPTVYIVRDGRDVLVSETYFAFDFGGDQFGYQDWNGVLLEHCRRGEWNRHILWYMNERPKMAPFVWVRYEDLLNDPIGTFLWSLEQINVPVIQTSDVLIPFDELHHKWPKFFRRGISGAWKDEMPPEAQRMFWEHNQEAMDLLGYQ